MSTLIEDLCQEPVNPVITGKEDGVVVTKLLFQLNCYRHQLIIAIDIEEAHGSSAEPSLSCWDIFQDLQITNVYVTSLDY